MTDEEEQKTEESQQNPGEDARDSGKNREKEPVWTFRGYELRPSEFTTAMVHFFRAEVSRANVWRQRLDATTNWAVITTGAIISFAFGNLNSPHMVVVLNILMVTLFLFIESRRYRYYELWSSRVRLMETDFIASMLVPPFHPSPDWAETLAENLLHPHFTISQWEAMGRRLRRNYLWIYAVIFLAWFLKLWLIPPPAGNLMEFINRAEIGFIPGWLVILSVLVFGIVILALSLLTIRLQEAAGEVLPRYGWVHDAGADVSRGAGRRAWFRPSRRRRQLLTFIITDKAKSVTDRIFQEMGRGVTALSGTGMYTGRSHTVLMCALTVTEIPQLKSVVRSEDPNAFVIVSPAQEVFGAGFMPLEEEEE